MMQLPLNSLHFRKPEYCRKQQSLSFLCSSFLSLYERDGLETIALDDACAQLGVAKRRIYDIVNILGGIGLLRKKTKNHYSLRGFGVIPKALQLLKKEGLKESYISFEDDVLLKAEDDDEGDNVCSSDSLSEHEKSKGSSDSKLSRSKPRKSDNRKEKCLGLLTQNFVKLFLCYDVEIITFDEAKKILLGGVHDQSVIKTKIRRLYDITNVLSSMNFIQKTHHPLTRKPAFRWTGMSGKPQMATTNDQVPVSKKRAFGTELTNTSIRRCMVAPSSNATTDQIPDWESLAITHSPQYQNQALRDLFGHYMGAWNFFCSEVAGKNAV